MYILLWVAGSVASVSLMSWLWLMFMRGWFWLADQRFEDGQEDKYEHIEWPTVRIVVPARNEAETLPETLPTLLQQDYPGEYRIVLVDDVSQDGTGEMAARIAKSTGCADRLQVLQGTPLPEGWAGKVWAMHQGVSTSEAPPTDYILFTDADISYPRQALRRLVLKAQRQRLDMTSLMVRLRVDTVWARLLIPAFVFFFGKLYPFRWANDPDKSTAAAAGGCMLVRRESLERAGGLENIRDALIDDCALAKLIKDEAGAKIWLGLSREVKSVRRYEGLSSIWNMVARSAYAQLRFSPVALAFAVLGMVMVYLAPPLALAGGVTALVMGPEPGLSIWLTAAGGGACLLMTGSYLPMLRWYETSIAYALLLPLTEALYTMMTVDSAVRTWRGRGGQWRGRVYSSSEPTSSE